MIHIPLEVTHPSTNKVTSSQPFGVSLVPEHPGKRHVDPGLKVNGLRVETMYCVLFEERTLTCRSTTHHASQRNLQSGSLQFVQMRNYSNFTNGSLIMNTFSFIIRTSTDHVKLYIAGGDVYILTPYRSFYIAAIA